MTDHLDGKHYSQSASTVQRSRVIRFFVSSTFLDMQAERDELVKFIFPQLRKLCEQRGVTWGDVDLRWGITEQQVAEGKVLSICLTRIQQCRPYFIGLLGERYGWIPDEIPQEIIEREPWLAKHRGHSVTELEILHGALNNPSAVHHAYFYFRDPKFIDTVPGEQRTAFLESATAEESKQKLQSLKEQIRASGLPVQENYRDAKQLGELILRDLTAMIDRLYPEGSQPDPLDRDAADHDAFARSRADVYIGRQEYFDRLDAHAQSDAQPLIVLGESGVGKSALLANWAFAHREKYPNDVLLLHFIGATPDSADWMAMLRRILGEFKRRFDIREEIPDRPDALRAAFANCLHMAAAHGRVVLILDALNQLEDRDGAPDLVWLPPVIPANVRMIFSTLPGRALDELTKRDWQTLHVEPLKIEERTQLIKEYLAQYTKSLSPAQMELVANSPQADNPLYLRVLLEELRVFGIYEKLNDRIGYYLDARSIDELYERILARYEADYERERPGLVRDAMSMLWAARHGLSEVELLELLGTKDAPLPHAFWSPLSLAAEHALVSRTGLIGFFHSYLRQAVQNRYLPTEQEQQACHLRLADYFANRELGARKVNEQPWQLAAAKAWERLYSLLTDLVFFDTAWQINEWDIRVYWAQIESGSPLGMVTGYQKVVNAPSEFKSEVVRKLGLLFRAGHPDEAILLFEGLVDVSRRTGDYVKLSDGLGTLAELFMRRGQEDRAMPLVKEQEEVCREQGNQAGLAVSLMNQGHLLTGKGDIQGALASYRQCEQLCRETGNKAVLQAILIYIAEKLIPPEHYNAALALPESIPYHTALTLDERADLDTAMTLVKEQEGICRELGDKVGLAMSWTIQASILDRREDWDGVLALLRKAEHIYRDLGNKFELAVTLGKQIRLVDYDQFDLVVDEAMEICRSCGYTNLQDAIEGIAAETYTQNMRDRIALSHILAYSKPVKPVKKRPLFVSIMSIGLWLSAAYVAFQVLA